MPPFNPRFFATWPRALGAMVLASVALLVGGCDTFSGPPPKLVPEICAEIRGTSGGKVLTLPISGIQYTYSPTPVIIEIQIADVDLVAQEQPNGQQVQCLLLTMSDSGRRELARQTVLLNGGHLFLFVNGKVLGVHKIDQPINDGNLQMYMEIPDKDLPAYAKDLKESVKLIQKKWKDR